MMIDEAFVSTYGPNLDVVRMKAENIFQDMKDGLEPKLSNLGYETEFTLIHFSEVILPNTAYSSVQENWATNITNHWKSGIKNCIKKDIIILLTGRSPGWAGYRSGNAVVCEHSYEDNNVVIVTAANMKGETLGHEIMHTFGLDHLDELIEPQPGVIVPATICASGCTDTNPHTPNPLMCYQGGDYRFTSCDIICLQQFFEDLKCPCLQIST